MNKILIIIIILLITILALPSVYVLLCKHGNITEEYAAPYTVIIEMPNGEITEVDAYAYDTVRYGRVLIIYTKDGNKIRVSNCKVAIVDKQQEQREEE